MNVFTWLGQRKRAVASVGVVTISVLAVTTAAALYPGFPTADVQLNDGSVWVTKSSDRLVGRFNNQSRVLDAGVRAVGADYDIVQAGRTVLLVDDDESTLSPIDPATVALTGSVDLPRGALVALGAETVAIIRPADGTLWVMGTDSVGSFSASSTEPVAELGEGARVTVGVDGVVHAVSPESGEVLTVRLTVDGLEQSVQSIDRVEADDDVQIAAVASRPVVLDSTAGVLWIAGAGAHDIEDAEGAMLQQSSGDAAGVAYATATALVTFPFAGGAATVAEADGDGVPAAPVSVKGCVYGVWSGSARFVRDCVGEQDDLARDVELTAAAEPRFRVNRDVVVLNDIVGGTAWMASEELESVDDWTDVMPPDDGDDEETSESEVAEETSLPERSTSNSPPVADDDEFGVRPGRTTQLPVLDNDADPDGDVLTAAVAEEPGFGIVSPIHGGRGLQIFVPDDATGLTTFTYDVSDGRDGTDRATVTLEVRDKDSNGRPEQRKTPVITVEQGGSISYDVLLDWIDPDGDDLFLAAATEPVGDEVDFTSDGQLTFRATGSLQGRREIGVTVSDGTDRTEGIVRVDVRPVGSTKPFATPDHVVVRVGEPTTVSPLANDISPGGAILRLARVEEKADAVIATDFAAGTFSFVSQTPGTYYVQYLATDGPQTVIGLVRIDVLPAADPGAPPVAVRDVALLPGGSNVRVDVLANDSDPAGGILVVQSAAVPPGARISVAVIDHRYLQIEDSGGQGAPITIRYRISNGMASAEGDVVVIPIPAHAQGRPPVASDDTAVVRAGDIVTIPVLDNDFSPGGDALTLIPDLVEPLIDPADGDVFVSEDTLRFRAGPEAKTVYTTYEVVDSAGQKDAGYVTIQILSVDADNNSAPRPRDLVARAISGTTVRIVVPLDGIDPDGDSVQLVGLASAPAKGRVVEVGQNWLAYEAFAGSVGSDVFTYTVQDRLGRIGTASVRVGIAGADGVNQAPFAVKDSVFVRPDRRISVPVLSNDSDPEGDPIRLVPDGLRFPEGLEASILDDRVVVTTSDATGPMTVAYTIADSKGAKAVGALVVTVAPDLPLLAPIARDDRVTAAQIGDSTVVDVDVLSNDEDPDGVRGDLEITLGTGDASVVGGKVRVEVAEASQVITYTVTDADGLAASAFIVVPGTTDLRPTLRLPIEPIEVMSGEERTIRIADHVVVAGGGAVIITEYDKVSASHSNGQPLVRDASTLVYTSADGYFGQDALTFQVTDGDSPEDPDGRLATLTIPITVLPLTNQPPVLTTSAIEVAPGEAASTLDLAALATDPNPDDRLTFTLEQPPPDGFTASVSGSVLTVAAEDGVAKGTPASVTVAVSDGVAPPVTGTIRIVVIASTQPLAVATDDVVSDAEPGATRSVAVLANDQNPFPGEKLTLLRTVRLEPAGADVEAVVVGDEVEVTPSDAYSGTVVVVYRIGDATGDADREVEGRIRLTVQGRPAAPGTPTVSSVQDHTVVLSWSPPASNGAEITGYTVQSTSGGYERECAATTCTLDDLVNNTEYFFTVTATNRIGESDPSPPSAMARPDARPDTPQPPKVTRGERSLGISWVTPATPGSPVESYDLEISPAPLSGSPQKSGITGNTFSWTGLENGTAYQVRVRARNRAPEPSSWSAWSATAIPAGRPAAPGAPSTAQLSSVGNQAQLRVSWTAPADNGDAISEYTVRALRGGTVVQTMNVPAGQTSQAFNVDPSATPYTFTVEASNAMGKSGPSAPSAPRLARIAPGAPTGVSASPGNNTVSVSATAPSAASSGFAPSDLRYEYSVNGGGWRADWVSLSAGGTVSGTIGNGAVPNTGGPYRIALRAYGTADGVRYDGAGSGQSAPVQPFGRPFAAGVSVSYDGASGGSNYVTVSWTAPASNGRPVDHLMIYINGVFQQAVAPSSGSLQYYGNWWGTTVTATVKVVDAPPLYQETDASASVGIPARAIIDIYKGSAMSGPTCQAATCNYFGLQLNDGYTGSLYVCMDGNQCNWASFVNGYGEAYYVMPSTWTGFYTTADIAGYVGRWEYLW